MSDDGVLRVRSPVRLGISLDWRSDFVGRIKTLLVLDTPAPIRSLRDSVGLRGGPGRHAQAEWFARLWVCAQNSSRRPSAPDSLRIRKSAPTEVRGERA